MIGLPTLFRKHSPKKKDKYCHLFVRLGKHLRVSRQGCLIIILFADRLEVVFIENRGKRPWLTIDKYK